MYRHYLYSIPILEALQKKIAGDGTFEETLQVYNSLSKSEQELLGINHINSSSTVYRKVIRVNDKPIGYIELDDTVEVYKQYNEKINPNIKDLMIGLAVDKNFRNQGIGKLLLQSAIDWFRTTNYTTLHYYIRYGNDISKKLLKNFDFQFEYDDNKNKEESYIMYNT